MSDWEFIAIDEMSKFTEDDMRKIQGVLCSPYCSCKTPHSEHTWGGRPMILCPGIVGSVGLKES